MPRSMLALLSLPLLLAVACKDDDASAFVDDALVWKVTCGGGRVCSFPTHQVSETVEFDVSCQRTSSGINVEITAPADVENGLPTGTITIERLDPERQTCIVRVKDFPSLSGSQIDVVDTCKASAGNGGCTVRGAFKEDGWDFSGTLACASLTNAAAPGDTYLLRAPNAEPLTLLIDNCR